MSRDEHTVQGVLELHPRGFGFLRNPAKHYVAGQADPYVAAPMIQKLGLREGLLLAGPIEPPRKGSGPRLLRVDHIEGKKPDAEQREYLYHGIAARPFRRVFSLADYVQVKQASFKDGLLIVDLIREVPDSMKPRRIPIGNAGASRQIEQKAA